ALHQYLVELCRGIAAASSSADQRWTLSVDAAPLIVKTDLAVPLGLIVNELITNSIQHSQPSGGDGRVQIVLKAYPDHFSMSVSDQGDGPGDEHAVVSGSGGLGARMVDAFARQIDAAISSGRGPAGYTV